jgi:hypothetical protein
MGCRLPPIILLLLAGCTAPAVQPPPTEEPPGTGAFVTVPDYEGSLALRFELNGKAGTNCTYRQEWVGRPGPGIDYFIIRERDPSHTYGGYSSHSQFVQVGDKVDTRDFSHKGDPFYARVTDNNYTMRWSKEVIVLVFGNLENASEAPMPNVPTLHAGFDCHAPGSVKLLGAGTEVVPISFDRFNSTAAAALPRDAVFLSSKFMVNGTLSATFKAPLVEVRLSGIPLYDLAQVTLTHPNGTEDWTVLPLYLSNPRVGNSGWNHEFFGGPGTYALNINQAQGGSWWGVMMGFDDPMKLVAMLNVTAS